MNIRNATINDLDAISEVEAKCFPPAEAATKEEFKQRLTYYANHFYLMFDDDKLIAFTDGFVTDERDLTDEMYERADMHNESGSWQMIFGVNTLPEYRKHGYAEILLRAMIRDAKKQGRKGLVLTCKDKLVNYYSKLGFRLEGVSDSVHGGVSWNQMRLELIKEIDLSKVESSDKLHDMLARELHFPEFYGKNWDALWDAITGLVDMPSKLTFKGWDSFSKRLPEDAAMLKSILDDYNDEYPDRCEVKYDMQEDEK